MVGQQFARQFGHFVPAMLRPDRPSALAFFVIRSIELKPKKPKIKNAPHDKVMQRIF